MRPPARSLPARSRAPTPARANSVQRGTSVVLYVSSGITVPNVVGDDCRCRAGRAQPVQRHHHCPDDHHRRPRHGAQSEPAGGQGDRAGAAVTLTVAAAPTTVKVPRVVGETAGGAVATLVALGLNTNQVPTIVHNPANVGLVVMQDPTLQQRCQERHRDQHLHRPAGGKHLHQWRCRRRDQRRERHRQHHRTSGATRHRQHHRNQWRGPAPTATAAPGPAPARAAVPRRRPRRRRPAAPRHRPPDTPVSARPALRPRPPRPHALRIGRRPAGSRLRRMSVTASEVRSIAVVGGGLMGSGIAESAAVAGLHVVLRDIDDESVERAEHRIDASLEARRRRRQAGRRGGRGDRRAHHADHRPGRDHGRRVGDRGRLPEERGAEARGDGRDRRARRPGHCDRLQHLVDPDHPARRRDRQPRARAGAALLLTGAGDEAAGDRRGA